MALLQLAALMLLWTVTCSAGDYPANEYEYSIRREQLIQAELAYQGKENDLTADEKLVDHYLQHLKWAEFMKTKDRFLPSMSLNETIMEEIMASDVYKALKKLPKGGNMHSHENHEVGKRTLLEIVFNSTDFEYLWMSDPDKNDPGYSWKLKFGINSPYGDDKWIKVKDSKYTLEDILPHQTLFGVLSDYARETPTNSGQRWKEINQLWGRATSLIGNIKIKREYTKALYKKNLDEGVQYIETRKSVGGSSLYKVDPNVTDYNGIVYLETRENAGQLEINMTLEIIKDFIAENPSFIGHKRITYSSRKVNGEDMQKDMDKAIRLHKMYPDHLLGFDMVGEEDAGNSHIFFLKNFMDVYDSSTEKSKIPFYLHTAETNWPGDLITGTNDKNPVATLQNTYEAVLLGSKRVGHGLGYIRHPYLLKALKEKNVAVEICPISNQILGYIVDLRTHPAINYLRNGVPVVLGADDPGTFGYDHFTIDWYSIFMAWGLDLDDMKQLAKRALTYSGMSDEEKTSAMTKFNAAWDKYVNETKELACSHTYTERPTVGRIIPREGLKSGGTKVHIFGRRFDKTITALCQNTKPKCKFGERETNAVYISNYHLVCESPSLEAPGTVNVSVSLGDGFWMDTEQQFMYNQDPLPRTLVPGAAAPSLSSGPALVTFLLAIVTLLNFQKLRPL